MKGSFCYPDSKTILSIFKITKKKVNKIQNIPFK